MQKIWSGTINGKKIEKSIEQSMTLLHFLRDELSLLGTKVGCESGDCGACAVIIDKKLFNSCITPAFAVAGCEITTIEGLSENGQLHPIQKALLDTGSFQCGYCMPGMCMALKCAMDAAEHNLTEEEIREAISGNLCRCGSYSLVVEAISLLQEVKKS
ncbi:(2Fe-2S)-binding protein [Ruminococcaceae bacterium OttesenSCG-928-I18]|nr:(2Fe-2S)-binding protein [Ruminococcaceae bacterium OttesenSCG-928-I18]